MKNNELLEVAKDLLTDQPNPTALLANASAFLNESLTQINWVGFYLLDQDLLTVGPFQGKVACSIISLGKGVCGEAALKRETMIVPNVHLHENHIACDANSQSEIVIPIIIKGNLYGVLDVDSPMLDRFDLETKAFLESFVQILVDILEGF